MISPETSFSRSTKESQTEPVGIDWAARCDRLMRHLGTLGKRIVDSRNDRFVALGFSLMSYLLADDQYVALAFSLMISFDRISSKK